MSTILDRQLSDLIEAARRRGSAAVYAVLHQLRVQRLAGRQNEFAEHCCKFSGGRATSPDIARVRRERRH